MTGEAGMTRKRLSFVPLVPGLSKDSFVFAALVFEKFGCGYAAPCSPCPTVVREHFLSAGLADYGDLSRLRRLLQDAPKQKR